MRKKIDFLPTVDLVIFFLVLPEKNHTHLPSGAGHVIFVPLLVFLKYPLRFKKTRDYETLESGTEGCFSFKTPSWYGIEGIDNKSTKYYFQILGNTQKLERVFFFCATARILGVTIKKFLLFFRFRNLAIANKETRIFFVRKTLLQNTKYEFFFIYPESLK